MTSWLNWRDTSIQTTGDGGGVAGCEVKPVAAGARSVCGGVFVHREPWAALKKKSLLFRSLPSRDRDGKYTGSPAPSPSLSENPPQTRPSGGPGFNHPLLRLSSVWRQKLQSVPISWDSSRPRDTFPIMSAALTNPDTNLRND